MIYESRPNVGADASALCLKSGNAIILRGGSESRNSTREIVAAMRAGLKAAGLPEAAVQTVQTTDREAVAALLKADQFVDLVIPRGGRGLVELVRDTQTLLLPTDQPTIYETLESLKISAMIDGFRGRPPGDREAVVDAIINLTRFADSYRPRLDELDINPLMVLEDGVVAVDVLVRMAVSE